MRQFLFSGRRGDLPGFHDLLEFPQRLLDLSRWLLTQQGRQHSPEFTGRRVVLKRDAYYSTPPAGRALEAHVTGIIEVGSRERAPTDHFPFTVYCDFRIPLQGHAARRSECPSGMVIV